MNASHSPIVIDDEVAQSTKEQEGVLDEDRVDVLAEGAPSSKKGKAFRVEEVMIGTVPVYEKGRSNQMEVLNTKLQL